MPTRPKTHGQRQAEAGFGIPKRLNSHQRGYDRRWEKARKIFISGNPLCLYCKRQGRTSEATIVDHNPPHQGDMNKFWDIKTWTPCCESCHAFVTANYDGGYGRPLRFREPPYHQAMDGEVVE